MKLTQESKSFSQKVKREKEAFVLDCARPLFEENYQPTGKLLQLLDCVGMQPLNKSENALTQINNWAQKNLLLQCERWQKHTSRFEGLQPKIKPLLHELGFVDAIFPRYMEYKAAIVHGALLPRVRLRLEYLVEQWSQGIRFPLIYFLSGERLLDAQQENTDTFMDDSLSLLKIRKNYLPPLAFPKTEVELVQFIWEYSEIPEEMRKAVHVRFINAPMKKVSKTGKLIRPATIDTVENWLKTAPVHGRYVAVSNAPYIKRQDLIVRAIAPREYVFDTIGSRAGKEEKMAIFLDELARFIFQIKEIIDR